LNIRYPKIELKFVMIIMLIWFWFIILVNLFYLEVF